MNPSPPSDDGRGTGSPGTAPVAASPAVAPPAPEAARTVFGDRLALAERFADILADTGVSHGLIGPREVPILWDRHLLNCAVVAPAFPVGAEIADVGSGAGLPGLVLAIVRPDLRLHLVEPMLRRTTWLSATIEELGLTNCTVHRGRAEELHGILTVPYATARAVARLDKLARWTFPLLSDGGTLVALKGSKAQEELGEQERVLTRLGMTSARVTTYGEDLLEVPTLTVEAVVAARPVRGRGAGPTKRGKPTRRGGA